MLTVIKLEGASASELVINLHCASESESARASESL